MPTFVVDRDSSHKERWLPKVVEIYQSISGGSEYFILEGVVGVWMAGGVNPYPSIEAATQYLLDDGIVLGEQISEEPVTSRVDARDKFGQEFVVWERKQQSD